MENILTGYILASIIISIVLLFVVTRYGVQHYNKLNAAFFVFGSLVLGLSCLGIGMPIDYVLNYFTGGLVLFVAIVLLIFSRFAAYILAFAIFTILFLLLLINFLPSSVTENSQFVGISSLILALTGIFLSRKYIIKVAVGLWSGFYACMVLYDILVLIMLEKIPDLYVALIQPENATLFAEVFYLLNIIVIIFCIYFQLAMHEKVFGKKSESA